MKKLLALILATLLVLSLGAMAFADTDPKAAPGEDPSPVDPVTEHTFNAYQIFAGVQKEAPFDTTDNKTDEIGLGSITWGSGVNGTNLLAALQADTAFGSGTANLFANCTTASDVAAVMNGWGYNSDYAKAFAQDVYNNLGTAYKEGVKDGDVITDDGYYIIVDVTTFASDATDAFYNLALLQITDEDNKIQIKSKASIPEVKKEILDNVDPTVVVKDNQAAIGEPVGYRLTATLPSNLDDYDKYYIEFCDTLSSGLTYQQDAKVYAVNTVNGEEVKTDVTSSFTLTPANAAEGATIADPTADTAISFKCGDVKAIDGVTAATKFVVEYTAVVNPNAIIGPTGNPNEVELKYNNQPNKDQDGESGGEDAPKGTTPKDEVITYVTELTILKTDENGQALQGAEFTLSCENLFKVKVIKAETFVEDTDGEYWKLKDGTYTKTAPGSTSPVSGKTISADAYDSTTTKYKLTETTDTVLEKDENKSVKAEVGPDGTVTFSGLAIGEYTLTETKTPSGYNPIEPITFTVSYEDGLFDATDPITVEADNTLYTEIVNQSGAVLPETGGIGTTIFYVVGAVLVAGAAIVLFAKKRVQE